MFTTLLRSPMVIAFLVSLVVNLGLFFIGHHYRGEVDALSSENDRLEKALSQCQFDNTTWKSSYNNLLSSCMTQSEVIISLGKDLYEERKESGDVVRDILMLSPEQKECVPNSETSSTQAAGGLNEPYTPRVAGLDDRLDSSLIGMLERAYNSANITNTEPATSNTRRAITTPLQ